LIERVPGAVILFKEAFNNLDLRQQKAQLQTILKSAHFYKDGKIELEFRGESGLALFQMDSSTTIQTSRKFDHPRGPICFD
jgi:hypothetical protein